MGPSLNTTAARFLADRSEIQALAREYWNQISAGEALQERSFERDFREARAVGYLSKELFLRVGRWKSVRNTSRYESNSDEDIRRATSLAFQDSDDANCILILIQLNGVALRTATAFLHWMHPTRFPILDFRVLAALGEPAPRNYENIPLYLRISNQIRELARHHGLDLRTLDRALWAWDKQSSMASPKRRRCVHL